MKAITIKALRSRGGIIEWDMTGASKQHVSRFWGKLVSSGEAPDTGSRLESANWWEDGVQKKEWQRPYDPEKHLAELSAFCGL